MRISRLPSFCIAAACALLATLAFTTAAAAADREFVGVLALAIDKSVADQLQLTDEQRQRLTALIERRENEVLELALSLRQADAAEREVKLGPFRQASEAEGLKLLDDRQRALLEQLRLRRAGTEAFAEADVAKKLNLSAEQITARDALLKARSERLSKTAGAEREVLRLAYEEQLLALLTAEQKKTWEATTGSAAAQPAQKIATASATSPQPTAAATGTATKSIAATPAPSGNAQLKFNFRYQPWGEVLDWFAQQAGLSLLMDAPPPGTLNYTDPRSYTPAEALDLMNGVLLTKGYTLIRRERMLIVVNLEDGIPPNLVSFVPSEKLDERGEFELLTTLFPIGNLSPDDVEKELRRLIGPQGSVVVLPKARQVQATETAGRLRLMRSVLTASTEAQSHTTGPIQAIEPTHIAAVDALPMLRQLLNIAEDSYADADGSVRLAIDPITGKLLVGGKPDRVAQVTEIMKAIDVPAPASTAAAVETPQLETYDVGAIDSATALAVLQTMLAGGTDLRLTIDPNTGKLIALARPSQHATIRATLDQLGREGRQVDVVPLQRLDSALAAAAISKMFGTATAGGPQVDADPISRQLIVRGTAGQLAAIRELLGKMGEQSVSGTQSAADTSTVRVLPLGSGSARRALEQMEAVWPMLRSNRIRVVTPSSNIESVFPGGRKAVPPSTSPTLPAPPQNEPAAKPAGAAPAAADPQTSDDAAPSRPVRVRTVSFLQPAPGAKPQANGAAAPGVKAGNNPAGKEAAPIVVSFSPGGVVLASDDVEALNEFEALFNSLVNQAAAAGKEFTVFYLENAGAVAAAETLEAVFGSGGGSGGGRSMMGDLASMALGDVGGGLVGAMMGGGAGPAPSIMSSASVLIVPDVRLNALIVQASPADLDLIEQLLRVVDRVDVPESTVNPKPRIIPVRNTSATQVAEVVREVYQERLAGANRQRQPSPEEFMQMLRGAGGGSSGRGGASSSRNRQAEAQKISIGVDARTNSLIVSASEPVFQEIEQLVRTLDQTTIETSESIRVVTLKRSNAAAVQKALTAIVGEDVQTSRRPSSGGSSGSGGSDGGGSSNPNTGLSNEARQVQEMMRQRMEMFNQLRGGASPSRGSSSRGR